MKCHTTVMSHNEESDSLRENSEDIITVTMADNKHPSFQRVVVTEIADVNYSSKIALTDMEQDRKNCRQLGIDDDDAALLSVNGNKQEKQSTLTIISSDQDYKTTDNLVTYSNIQANSFMEQEDVTSEVALEEHSAANQSSEENSIIHHQETNEMNYISQQTPGRIEEESKDDYDDVTEMTSSADSNPSQNMYPPAQSISTFQHLSGHTMLSASELPDGFSASFSNASIPSGMHYILNTPQGLQTVQAINQQTNSPVIVIQVPSSQSGNQMLMPQVGNGQFQQGNMPITVTQVAQNSDAAIDHISKKPRTKGRGRAKAMKQETNVPLRPLAPRMFAVPISSPLLLAPSSGNSQMFSSASVPQADQIQQLTSVTSTHNSRTAGQHFEVLGRCIMCFRFCRTTTYCRAEKSHTDVRAAACAECEEKGSSTVVCRRKRQHKYPNAYPPNIVINIALQRAVDLKEMCLKNLLPPCFSDLQSLAVHHADCVFAQPRVKAEADNQVFALHGVLPSEQTSYRKPTDYARGYLYPYSKEAWEQWLDKFCLQTGTSYRIRTGKRVNKKSDHGLANHNGKIVVYRALETQLYNCALGGKPRRKALREGSRRRKARGSKLIGCSAVIHTRLIVTEEDWKALEITLPKLSAHLPAHDPRIRSNDLQPDMNMLLPSSLYVSDQGVPSEGQEEFAILDDVGFHTDADTDLTSDQMQLLNSLHSEDIKKQTKHLIKACGILLDDVSNLDFLKAVNLQVHSLYTQLQKSCPKRSCKRTAAEADLVDDEEVLEEGESRQDSVSQVVLLQTDHQ